ncbi:MAG: SPOR domain-containing protein [Bacteroidia bacterium]|nr:SPOR domain-containing protein [Bacteroidia bacterium]MDW8235437.1 SPOR domain-containing protein [Bacteroidia bacterium]
MAGSIDFQQYVALLMAEMPRFSLPGVGSFIWNVEKVALDPKAGTIAPPRCAIKYEPGHRFQHETIAFLRDYFSIEESEAEALLREIGRLTSTYLKATSEMDVWRIGKLKRVGSVYKVELAADAPVPWIAGLQEVSLRAGAAQMAVAAPPKPTQTSAPLAPDKPRARIVDSADSPEPESQPSEALPRKERKAVRLIVILTLIVGVLAGITFWLMRRRKPPAPVEIVLTPSKPTSATKPSPASPQEETPKPSASSTPKKEATPPEKEPANEVLPKKSEKGSPSIIETPAEESRERPRVVAKKPERTASEPKAPTPNKPKYRYYVIVGAYPSREEAEKKAAEFSRYGIEYLPGKQAGWVRLGVAGTNDKKEAQKRLSEMKSQVPDAWLFTAP